MNSKLKYCSSIRFLNYFPWFACLQFGLGTCVHPEHLPEQKTYQDKDPKTKKEQTLKNLSFVNAPWYLILIDNTKEYTLVYTLFPITQYSIFTCYYNGATSNTTDYSKKKSTDNQDFFPVWVCLIVLEFIIMVSVLVTYLCPLLIYYLLAPFNPSAHLFHILQSWT